MGWFIQSEYKTSVGPVEITIPVPVVQDVEDTLTAAFAGVIKQVIADAPDDDSDIGITVAYIGDQKSNRT